MSRNVPYYRLPDGGRSPIVKAPKVPTPRLPVSRQPDGGLYPGPGGQFSQSKIRISTPAKPKAKATTPKAPKLSVPSAAGNASSFGIQLPGVGSTATMASIYSRTQAQLKAMARDAVLSETRPQVRALDVSTLSENSNYNAMIRDLSKQLGLSKGDISNLYSDLDVALAYNAKKQADQNAKTKAGLASIYDSLTSQLGSTYSKAQGNTAAELSRLGISDPQANDRLTADQALLQSQSAQAKTNSTSLVDAINASTQGLMTGLRAGNAGTGSMLMSQLQQQFDKTKGDALQKHLANIQKIKEERAALISSEPSKINQTYAALLDQQYQREMDAAQQLFDNQIKLGNFQLATSTAQQNAADKQNQLALDAQRVAIAAKNASAKPSATLKGPDKALDFVKQISAKAKIPYNSLETALIDAINGNPDPNHTIPGFESGRQSTYAMDLQNALKDRGVPNLYNDMIRAMQYWFGS
jgi:hypothetical protein